MNEDTFLLLGNSYSSFKDQGQMLYPPVLVAVKSDSSSDP